jgi:hypothetical protein
MELMEVVPLERRYLINRRTVIATFCVEYSELLLSYFSASGMYLKNGRAELRLLQLEFEKNDSYTVFIQNSPGEI